MADKQVRSRPASKRPSMVDAALMASKAPRKTAFDRKPADVQADIHAICKELARSHGSRRAALRIIHSYGHKDITRCTIDALVAKYISGELK